MKLECTIKFIYMNSLKSVIGFCSFINFAKGNTLFSDRYSAHMNAACAVHTQNFHTLTHTRVGIVCYAQFFSIAMHFLCVFGFILFVNAINLCMCFLKLELINVSIEQLLLRHTV